MILQPSLNARVGTTSGTLESMRHTLSLQPLPAEILTHPPDSDVRPAVAPSSHSPAPSSHVPPASTIGSQHALESTEDEAISSLVVIRRPPNGNASDCESEQDDFDQILLSIDEDAILQDMDRVNSNR